MTESDGREEAVSAGEVAGDGEGQSLAGRKINSARTVGGASDDEHKKQ
jgi:hypothetical protein